MDKIGKIIIFILILGVIVYAFRSGVISNVFKAIESSRPKGSAASSTTTTSGGFLNIAPSSPSSGNGSFGLGGPPGSSGGGTGNNGGGNNGSFGNGSGGGSFGGGSGSGSGNSSSINPADVPQGFTMAQLSPHFHQVRIGSASYGYFGSYGTI